MGQGARVGQVEYKRLFSGGLAVWPGVALGAGKLTYIKAEKYFYPAIN